MKYEMRNAKGHHKNNAMGMSCPQVSVNKKGFIILERDLWKKTGEERYKSFLYFLNPKIIKTSDELKLHWEGCLSFPE